MVLWTLSLVQITQMGANTALISLNVLSLLDRKVNLSVLSHQTYTQLKNLRIQCISQLFWPGRQDYWISRVFYAGLPFVESKDFEETLGDGKFCDWKSPINGQK